MATAQECCTRPHEELRVSGCAWEDAGLGSRGSRVFSSTWAKVGEILEEEKNARCWPSRVAVGNTGSITTLQSHSPAHLYFMPRPFWAEKCCLRLTTKPARRALREGLKAALCAIDPGSRPGAFAWLVQPCPQVRGDRKSLPACSQYREK
ncbi:hypothetical protein NDU88_002423 [Pleurodeles waltl]|uniref:Uncharacterized protein n=1 Tax=Pleurodeles waltl TaxID=8319 RepID=A0AAV7M250_PLEWA|nr:hypothetical protein NDU88_002423 [Pleurodeles waltl]